MEIRRVLVALVAAVALIVFCAAAVSADIFTYYPAFSSVCEDGELGVYSITLPEGATLLSSSDRLPAPVIGSSVEFVEAGETEVVSVNFDAKRLGVSLAFEPAAVAEAADEEETEAEDTEDAQDTEETSAEVAAAAVKVSNNVGFCIYVPSADSSGTLSVTIRIKCKSELYVYRVPVVAGVPSVVICDTEVIPDSDPLDKITLSVSCGDMSSVPDHMFTTLPFTSDSWDFTFQRQNSLDSFAVLSGEVDLSGGVAEIFAGGTDEPCVIHISAPGDSMELSRDSSGRNVYLYAEAQRGSGSVMLMSDDGKSLVGSPTSVSETSELITRLSESEDTWTARLTVRPDADSGLVLSSLGFVPTDEENVPEKSVITSISYDGDSLEVQGRLGEEAVTAYMGEKLGLYMQPAIGSGETVLLGNVSVSSRFSFKIPSQKLPGSVSQGMFFVGVKNKDDSVTALSYPKFASLKSALSTSGSPFGLYGADPISVYESGAGQVMVDVDLSRLLSSSSSSGSTVTGGGYVFGVRSDYVRELDSDIGFYASYGARVHLKFICSSPLRSSDGGWLISMDRPGKEYMVNLSSDEGIGFFVAGVSYLCSRYSNVESIVISSAVNSVTMTGMNPDDLYGYAARTALLAHLAYGAAYNYNNGIYITLPLADSDTIASAGLFGALFSERLSVLGQIPWATMYTVTDTAPGARSDSVASVARSSGTSIPAFSVMLWEPDGDGSTVVKGYAELCDNVDTALVRTIFLSPKSLDSEPSRDDLHALRQENLSEGTVLIYGVTMDAAEAASTELVGSHRQWDFTSLYSADGWIPGYGIASLETVETSVGSRTLRCVTAVDNGEASGIMLCTPSEPLDLSVAPYAEIVYSCMSDSSVSISFLFGSGENRIEFSVSEPQLMEDGSYKAVCDLGEFATLGTVSYVGIILRGDESVTFDLSQITFASAAYGSEEIAKLISVGADEEEEAALTLPQITAVAVAAMTLTGIFVRILVVLLKADKERAASAPPRKRGAKKYRNYIFFVNLVLTL